ncbi:MAG: hypothetical protein ACFB10_20430 [Salibacteraceae bacterium]
MTKLKFKVDRSRPSKASLQEKKDFDSLYQSYKQQHHWWNSGSKWMLWAATALIGLGVLGWYQWQKEPVEAKLSQPLPLVVEPNSAIAADPQTRPADTVRSIEMPPIAGQAEPRSRIPKLEAVQLYINNGHLGAKSTTGVSLSKDHGVEIFSNGKAVMLAEIRLPLAHPNKEVWAISSGMATMEPLTVQLPQRVTSSLYLNEQQEWQNLTTSEGGLERKIPAAIESGKLTFQFAYDANTYPELAGYERLTFHAAPGFEAELGTMKKYSWTCKQFQKIGSFRYEAVFKKFEATRKVELVAVIDPEERKKMLKNMEKTPSVDPYPTPVVVTQSWLQVEAVNTEKATWKKARFVNAAGKPMAAQLAYWQLSNGVVGIDPKGLVPLWTEPTAVLYVKTTDNQWWSASLQEVNSDGEEPFTFKCLPWRPNG